MMKKHYTHESNYTLHFRSVLNSNGSVRFIDHSRNKENTIGSPHRKHQQPIQCGYCSSCILRKQALAASKIKDKTRYVVPHGDHPAGDPSLHLRHMLAQVSTFRHLLGASDNLNFQWKALTKDFTRLDDIVDRSAAAENLLPADMQSCLIKLYRTYVAEWDTVESQIAADFLDKDSERQASSELSLHKVEGLLP